jgi:hypothetical protein
MSRRGGPDDAPIEAASGWLALLGAILSRTTSLPRAACKGLAPTFDLARTRGRQHGNVNPAAVALCRSCPERPVCGLCPGRTDGRRLGGTR